MHARKTLGAVFEAALEGEADIESDDEAMKHMRKSSGSFTFVGHQEDYRSDNSLQ